MDNVKVGQTIRVNIAVWDFCGQIDNSIFISDVGIDTIPSLDSIVSCQDITGLTIEFKLVTSEYMSCKNCNPEVTYSIWGTAYTNSQGYAYIDHTITQEDLAAYQAAVASGKSVKVLACITGTKGQQVLNNNCSLPLTVLMAAAPTHYVSLSLGFVPPELMDIFDTWITEISGRLLNYMAPFPSPWEYVKTTYERGENSFRIWLRLPPTSTALMVMSSYDDLMNFLSVWVPVVLGIIAVIIGAGIIATAGTLSLGLVVGLGLLIGGASIIIWKVNEISTSMEIAKRAAKNYDIQVNVFTNFDNAKQNLIKAWDASQKTLSDCTTRLNGFANLYLASVIDSYIEKYSKYSALTTELQAERAAFLTASNAIISEFKTKPYDSGVCDTYYSQLDSAITSSKTKVNEIISINIDPTKPYEMTCIGWTNQAACEQAECFWYDSSCHKEENCWIPSPLGGCTLSAGTGRTIVGVTVGLVLLGTAYWLLTRKRAEVTSIYVGAREAVTTEAERAKAAYRSIRPPSVPATARLTVTPVPRVLAQRVTSRAG